MKIVPAGVVIVSVRLGHKTINSTSHNELYIHDIIRVNNYSALSLSLVLVINYISTT